MRLEVLYYYYRRNRWIFRPDLFFFKKVKPGFIDQPIFVTGHQGNGSTVVSRVLRRVENVVTLSGDCRYWSGADEMQSALAECLPDKFGRLSFRLPPSCYFRKRRGWSYACDEQLPYYCFSELDMQEKDREQFLRVLQGLILMNSRNKGNRFLDKSQSYALKIPLLRAVLDGCNPKFIGIVRNPYVACYRAAMLKTGLAKENLSVEFRLRTAAQHWNNTVRELLRGSGEDLKIFRIEDIIKEFESKIGEIADFCNLSLDASHFPSEKDTIPFGSRRKERWYPIKRDINSRYLESLPVEARRIIREKCGRYIDRFDYHCEQ